ncbi:MAG: hypothetical protein IPL50_12145 [Chitinophagaceae bacterium]|nr:hypothetical protein [Chitinophagaceae bacterium]
MMIEKPSLFFNLSGMAGGVASKLLLNASAAGHMMKLSFLSLSVFGKSITIAEKSDDKTTVMQQRKKPVVEFYQ